MRARIDRRAMALLSAGHLATDFAGGALPALLPYLVREFELSYTLAGLTILAWALSSSVVQPAFGLLSDRRGALWLLPAGLALAGVGIGLAAVAPSYWTMLALVTLFSRRLVARVSARNVRPTRATGAASSRNARQACSSCGGSDYARGVETLVKRCRALDRTGEAHCAPNRVR